jgi:hypothetical protein
VQGVLQEIALAAEIEGADCMADMRRYPVGSCARRMAFATTGGHKTRSWLGWLRELYPVNHIPASHSDLQCVEAGSHQIACSKWRGDGTATTYAARSWFLFVISPINREIKDRLAAYIGYHSRSGIARSRVLDSHRSTKPRHAFRARSLDMCSH